MMYSEITEARRQKEFERISNLIDNRYKPKEEKIIMMSTPTGKSPLDEYYSMWTESTKK